MGESFQLTLEGTQVEGLRASLPAIHFIPDRPYRSGEKVRITIDAVVSELRFPYDSDNSNYKLRQHMLEAFDVTVTELEGADSEVA